MATLVGENTKVICQGLTRPQISWSWAGSHSVI